MINIVYAFFDTFAIVDAATQGGPGKDTAILVYKVYYDGFKALDLGGSAAQSVVLMVIVIALTVVQFRFVEKKVQLLRPHGRTRPVATRAVAPRADPGRADRRLPGLPHLRRLDPHRRADRADVRCRCCRASNLLENYQLALFGGATEHGAGSTRRWRR